MHAFVVVNHLLHLDHHMDLNVNSGTVMTNNLVRNFFRQGSISLQILVFYKVSVGDKVGRQGVCNADETGVINDVADLVRIISINFKVRIKHQESILDFKLGRNSVDFVNIRVVVNYKIRVYGYDNVIDKRLQQEDF